MKYNLELLKADINDELEKLDSLYIEFSQINISLIEKSEEVSFYHRGAIGYYLHNFYNGCENIFKSIARFFENDFDQQSLHTDLLKRMKLQVNGYRPKVIDKNLFRLLDEFRRFRHIFRHSYTFELDWEKESVVANKLNETYNMLHNQIKTFLEKLKEIE